MTPLTCDATRDLLQAYHDEELPVEDQIAVSTHIGWCRDCRGNLEDLQELGTLIKTGVRTRSAYSAEEDLAFHRGVVARLNAEDSMTLTTRMRDVFDDMRLVYAGLGATAAAITCFLMMLNMMRFVTEDHRPDSLAARVNSIASLAAVRGVPAVQLPAVVDARQLTPSGGGATFAADFEDDLIFDNIDAEFVINAVISREGKVENVELVRVDNGQPVERGTKEAAAFEKMMGAVAQTRYTPASVGGLPVAVNKVWLVAHTTVHGSKDPRPLGEKGQRPGAKKRLTAAPVQRLRPPVA
ncbi:MAG TPA: zf-HC2 domain-containing protein [Vicinamibacterales bacterium]|jgi:hypothetical protein|nr:zf-HC2 domain-containing protein [Vicinamibacterales bacterium]